MQRKTARSNKINNINKLGTVTKQQLPINNYINRYKISGKNLLIRTYLSGILRAAGIKKVIWRGSLAKAAARAARPNILYYFTYVFHFAQSFGRRLTRHVHKIVTFGQLKKWNIHTFRHAKTIFFRQTKIHKRSSNQIFFIYRLFQLFGYYVLVFETLIL